MKKIYFSCSITGGRLDEAVYTAIVDDLQAHGHEVVNSHLARQGVMLLEQGLDPREVYQRDVFWIKGCDAVVAEVAARGDTQEEVIGDITQHLRQVHPAVASSVTQDDLLGWIELD